MCLFQITDWPKRIKFVTFKFNGLLNLGRLFIIFYFIIKCNLQIENFFMIYSYTTFDWDNLLRHFIIIAILFTVIIYHGIINYIRIIVK